MGDWTDITIGEKKVMWFKDRLQLHIPLIFERSDLTYDIEQLEPIYDEESEDDIIIGYEDEKRYKFESNVKKVKQVLDNRGITQIFCHKMFYRLRNNEVWVGFEDEYAPNNIDYDIYKKLLKERLFSTSERDEEFDEFKKYRLVEEALFDSEYPSFFWGEKGVMFPEILDIIYLRTILDLCIVV